MEKLSGKTALVTGSTDGVGRLVARKLGQAGARVLVHGRDAERGARVVNDIEASGGAADFFAADLSALAEVRRLADEAQARVDRLDILINNAGIGTAGPRQTSAGFEWEANPGGGLRGYRSISNRPAGIDCLKGGRNDTTNRQSSSTRMRRSTARSSARTLAEVAMRVPTAAAGFWSCAKPLLSASHR